MGNSEFKGTQEEWDALVAKNNIPRRAMLDKMTQEELLIRDAVNAVENLGADVRLTNCVIKLGEAKNHLSDFIDGVEPVTESFLDRLIREEKELGEKIVGLNKGIHSDGFAQKVGEYQFNLLCLQHSTMIAYRQILVMRIADLKDKS